MNAQILKGEGESIAAKIYNLTYASDPAFYKFHRSLQAYKAVFKKDNSSLILPTKAEFFQYLNIK